MKAIFFDLDDVLVFSERAHTKAWQLALPNYGVDPGLIDFQSLVGVSDKQQAQMFKEIFHIEEDAAAICEYKRLTFLEITQQGFESALGRNQFLENMTQKCIVGVVSSSPRSVIERVLAVEGITDYFQFIIGHEDCVKHKPDPTPYQNALALTGLKPQEALVIEDSVSGITAAQRAMIPVIGLFKDQRPDQIVHHVQYYNNFIEIQDALIKVA